MARIRSIKPEIASDAKLSAVSIQAAYTFVLMITQADDLGLLPGAHRQILGTLYPLRDDVTVAVLLEWIEELTTGGLVRWRQTRDGVPVLEITNWRKHQRVDNAGRSQLGALLLDFDEKSSPENLRLAEVRGEPPRLAEVRGLDLGSRTMDLGSRTKSSLHHARAREAAGKLAQRIPKSAHDDLRAVLTPLTPQQREKWAREMLACLDGMDGHHHATADQLCAALADFVANGKTAAPNFRQLRRYIEQATHPLSNGNGKPNNAAAERMERLTRGAAKAEGWDDDAGTSHH